jgi:hypothetical protein
VQANASNGDKPADGRVATLSFSCKPPIQSGRSGSSYDKAADQRKSFSRNRAIVRTKSKMMRVQSDHLGSVLLVFHCTAEQARAGLFVPARHFSRIISSSRKRRSFEMSDISSALGRHKL